MWLTDEVVWSLLYMASTFLLPAIPCAVFIFCLVLFTPRKARGRALTIAHSFFGFVGGISVLLFAVGMFLFRGFFVAPQMMLFLVAFVPLSGIALILAKFLPKEAHLPEERIHVGLLPILKAISVSVLLTASLVIAGCAYLTSFPKVQLANLESIRSAMTLQFEGELSEEFIESVRGSQDLSNTAYMPRLDSDLPESLRDDLAQYRNEQRAIFAQANIEKAEPLLMAFETLGLPSNLTGIQITDSLIHWAPQDSQRVESVFTFIDGLRTCTTSKLFYVIPNCFYRAADGRVYSISQSL